MADWSVKVDLGQTPAMLQALQLGLEDRTRLHEMMVIQTQGWVFRNWPKGPPLAPITLATRRKASADVLLDSGRGRLSITGRTPAAAISKADGTLNSVGKDAGVVGTNLPYMAIHQTGGTIRATNAKNLAIPMTRRARAAGSPRAFDKPLVFVPSRRPGTTGLLVEKGKGKPFKSHYVGLKEIHRNGKTIRVKNPGSWFWVPLSREAENAGAPSGMGRKLLFIETKDPEKVLLVESIERRRTTAHYLLKPSVYIPPRPFLPTPEQITPDLLKVADFYLQTLADGKRPGKAPGQAA